MIQISKENRAAYVMFERKAEEDRAATEAHGRYMTKDVDYAILTPIGSKDRIPREVKSWFKDLEQKAREERIPREWVQQYKAAYEAWLKGEEVPLNGTPIKEWSVLKPSERQRILGATIYTVEDLAQINDEAAKSIGMGAFELRTKAQKWLAAAESTGVVVTENSDLRGQINQLKRENVQLLEQNEQLKSENESFAAKLALTEA